MRAQLSFDFIARFAMVVLIAASASCSRGADRAANDTGETPDSLRADTEVAVPAFREWSVAAGRHLLIGAGALDSAVVVFPEFTIDSSLASARFDLGGIVSREYELFAPDGGVTVARVAGTAPGPRAGCDAWPQTAIAPVGEIPPWTIGLARGRASGIRYTPLDQHSAHDSATIVVILTRLASQAPSDTSVTFRGLPYVVRSAFAATVADSQSLVFGELVRRLNIEANPHEERTTIFGERSASTPNAPYSLAFSERRAGDEESVPTTELIGLVRLRNGTHAAFAARDYSDGGTYLMFERNAVAQWRLRWQSAYAGC